MANNHSEIEKRLWESADQLFYRPTLPETIKAGIVAMPAAA